MKYYNNTNEQIAILGKLHGRGGLETWEYLTSDDPDYLPFAVVLFTSFGRYIYVSWMVIK